MKKSRLFLVFNSLTGQEKRQFRKFLTSRYHNTRQDVVNLFDYLNTGKLAESELNKLVVHRAIFPGRAYDDSKIRYTMSFLFDALKRFLVQTEMEANEQQQQVWLIKALRKRGLEKEFRTNLNQAQRKINQQPLRNTDHHYVNYQLLLEEYEHEHQQKRSASHLQELSDSLSHFFVSSQLRLRCLQLANQTMSPADYRSGLLPQVLQFLEKDSSWEEQPAISLYYYGYLALTDTANPVHFDQLKNALVRFGDCFPPGELLDIYLLAINFCIRNWNQGKGEYLREVFELYKSGLEQNVFIAENRLSRWTYNNIVLAGLGLEEWDWVSEFLETYKPFLESKYREDSYQYNRAIFYYRKGNYHLAMELLQTVRIDEVQKDLNIRRMLLKMYYELEEFKALESLLDSFQHFLYRHKDIGYHRENYLNLIRFTRKLLQLKPYAKTNKERLWKSLEDTQAVAEKSWLLDQLRKK